MYKKFGYVSGDSYIYGVEIAAVGQLVNCWAMHDIRRFESSPRDKARLTL